MEVVKRKLVRENKHLKNENEKLSETLEEQRETIQQLLEVKREEDKKIDNNSNTTSYNSV